jgi:hypothetical protein
MESIERIPSCEIHYGNIKKEKNGKFERNPWGNPVMPFQPGYSDAWKKSVILETGDKLLVPAGSEH